MGDSPALRRILERIRQVAPPDVTVLLEGESGVGKELVASAIHGLSKRRHKRLVVVNCGAIPEGLIESELFGAEKGAYTGAVERRTGFFEEADGGTLFLDEIGEMPLHAQVRLLRVLETGQFTRVGGTTSLTTDARVVAATNKDLGAEVQEGRFREDLYYRLSTVVLRIPPLRERAEDIVPLFDAFVARFARQYDAPFLRVSPRRRPLLQRYAWPGNVRELRNVAEQAVVMVRQSPLTADSVRPLLRGVSASSGLTLAARPARPTSSASESCSTERSSRSAPRSATSARSWRTARRRRRRGRALVHVPSDPSRSWTRRAQQEVTFEPPAPMHHDAADPSSSRRPRGPRHRIGLLRPGLLRPGLLRIRTDALDGRRRLRLPESFEQVLTEGLPLPTMEEAEDALIAEALRRFDGNRRQSADALGISERTLYRKIKEA